MLLFVFVFLVFLSACGSCVSVLLLGADCWRGFVGVVAVCVLEACAWCFGVGGLLVDVWSSESSHTLYVCMYLCMYRRP